MSIISSRDVEKVLRTVFRRCVICDKVAPSCASQSCQSDQICVQTPPDCNTCQMAQCQSETVDPTRTAAVAPGPNVGAIAGGVVGGVAVVAVLTFIVWKYCLKGRRRTYDEGDWQEVDLSHPEKTTNDDFASRRSTRASTHTVASMASSVLTRASNIIQIAYIPGVTNRSGPGSPDLLVPPVPPIPSMAPSTGYNTPFSTSEQHFFLPDFRDSMASGMSDNSYARTSIAPSLARSLARGSVASTVYRQNAIVSPLPAQTIVRGKAAVVSVRSTGSNSPADTLTPGLETPPVPQIDPKHSPLYNSPGLSRGNSVRSTATLGPVRALTITKKKSASGTPPQSSGSVAASNDSTVTSPDILIPQLRPLTEVSIASTDDGFAHARARRVGDVDADSESDDDDHSRARQSLLRDSAITDIQDTPTSVQSPFSDSSSIEPSRPDNLHRNTSTSSALRPPPMTPIVEESSKRASSASKRTQSPFSDDNRSDI